LDVFNLDEAVWCALIPLGISARFALIGAGIVADEKTVMSMSRSGDRRELLVGPLHYGVIFVFLTIFYFKTIDAVVSCCVLCVGDGVAAIIGGNFGASNRLPYNRQKSVAGTLSFIITARATISLAQSLARRDGSWRGLDDFTQVQLLLVVIVSAAAESLTNKEYDNVLVSVASLATMRLMRAWS
jgi:dolichol kinase